MKKFLIISDTHRNLNYLEKVLKQEPSNDFIFHLGDDYEDMIHLKSYWKNSILYRVPGIFHPKYLSGELAKFEKVEIEGWNFILVHYIEDAPITSNSEIICYGHTHNPAIDKKNNSYFINPGHLKQAEHRGSIASYITLNVTNKEITLLFHNLKGEIINKKQINKI
ncbi:MAG: metallophosphoesterase family protein [Candidatus Cloacimonadota bacterium]|nr:metallophosphoesterase family protein [Candidatus Cloacimonadota bacterium]